MRTNVILSLATMLGIALTLRLPAQAASASENKQVANPIVFTIPKEEPHTTYSHRENWAHPRPDYFTTTQHIDKEGGRFDPSTPPTGTYVGTATAVFDKLPQGRYTVEVFYRRTKNRSKKVPWVVETDGKANNRASGMVDQFMTPTAESARWNSLKETVEIPLEVAGRLILVWGSDTDTGGRSISYGGARVRRVQ